MRVRWAPMRTGSNVKAVTQQWLTQRVLADVGADPFEAWVVYVGLGGTGDGVLVDGYLNGLLSAPAGDRDLIARAVNVLAEESSGIVSRAPTGRQPAWVDREEAFASYGAGPSPADLITPLVGARRAESLRLESLERTGLLRCANEDQVDAITAEAARRFPGCSSSLALITRDRQVITSISGTIGADGPRDTSFCHHTVGGPHPFVVTNAALDPRVSSNPLVTGGPRIRFYAGHPVRGPGGWRIGSLCVMSDKPRGFSPADARALELLAASVQGLIGV